ncbi:acetyl-CoA hydrolase/transferase family protein [Xanthovirga aplysinae]|uniref:acetyl-CoA hydrolase/transferase family protein n=1 Tax=Xanthovirga aplysinae TaxID=2529853 RepID=UPI0012BC7ACE|nr:acetyl-CoA hydrolase/transferase C-terminal domain-containing protein [Xanthovirga aplysinae]MTI32825.1 acetyl-CoA hydrolase/transferase family protein [Xanthovirga aplysinae]
MYKSVSAEQAVKAIESYDRVYIHSAAAAPQVLIDALVQRAGELKQVEIVHMHTEGEAAYVKAEYQDSFFLRTFFVGDNVREAVHKGRADYIPLFLSGIPYLFRKGVMTIDVALIQVSCPDKHGFVSLGVSVDSTLAAVECAKTVIAVVNPRMPRSHGDGVIPIDHIDILVDDDRPLYELPIHEVGKEEQKIGEFVAPLVDNGATLQIGIGSIPNGVMMALENHKRLGVHTEMFSDGLIPLIEKGVITGEEKKVMPTKVVSGFVLGSVRTYDFVDDNPGIALMDTAFVNDVATIRKNPKVTAVNSAIEIDLTGQVCADSIGERQYSGVGGQIDFMRGASYSEGGKPIVTLLSRTKNNESKIVPVLKEGAGVVSTRAHVHYVVTEFGVACLYGKSLMQRAISLIGIAHPDDRENLERAAYERFGSLNMRRFF